MTNFAILTNTIMLVEQTDNIRVECWKGFIWET